MIDGRTVYAPATSGVYCDQQDVPLEDIDRIEVSRGPGGTVWGANVVNGVLDIIAKNAGDTKGGWYERAAALRIQRADRFNMAARSGRAGLTASFKTIPTRGI